MYAAWQSSRLVSLSQALVCPALGQSEARRNLFPLIEEVNDDHTVVEIVSRRGNAVLMAADDYAALAETAYLLRSPENARRLLTAYMDAQAGRGLVRHELSDLESLADQA